MIGIARDAALLSVTAIIADDSKGRYNRGVNTEMADLQVALDRAEAKLKLFDRAIELLRGIHANGEEGPLFDIGNLLYEVDAFENDTRRGLP